MLNSQGSTSVTVCGNLTLDELVHNNKASLSPGGSALFASAAAAYVGARVNILGNIGEDYPNWITKRLEALGIGQERLKRTRGPSARFRITSNNGDRKLILLNAGNPIQRPPIFRRVMGVHMGPVFNEIPISLAAYLRKKCGFLSLDLQGFVRRTTRSGIVEIQRRNLKRLLELSDLVQGSIDEAKSQEFSSNKERLLDHILSLGPRFCTLTMGESGSLLGIRQVARFLVPAYPDRSITDTTGAGDVFAGSWLSTYLSTRDPVWAAAVGSAFGSLASRKTGLSKFSFARTELFRRAGWVFNHIESI